MKKIAPPVLLHTRPSIHAQVAQLAVLKAAFLAGHSYAGVLGWSGEWVGAGFPLKRSGRCGRHMGSKLRATAAQRVMGKSGSRGHDDAIRRVSKVQQKDMRGQKESSTEKLLKCFLGPVVILRNQDD